MMNLRSLALLSILLLHALVYLVGSRFALTGSLRAGAVAERHAADQPPAVGVVDLAQAHLERGLALAEQVDDPETHVAALNSLALVALAGVAAGGAGVFHDLTMIMLTNSNTTTAAQVQIKDAAAGTVRIEHMIPPNSGMVINFPVPFTQTTANSAWEIDLNAAVSTVYWTAQWIKRVA